MSDTITKTFIGQYIDLSKIVSVSDAKFIDRMGSGGWFVEFEIHIQLLDKPIVYRREFDYNEYGYENGKHKMTYGRDKRTPLAVERLQVQIDELVEQWRKTKVS